MNTSTALVKLHPYTLPHVLRQVILSGGQLSELSVYISGAMSKYSASGWNRDKFKYSEDVIRGAGFSVLNPHDIIDSRKLNNEFHRGAYLDVDLAVIRSFADIVCVIDDEWTESLGAIVEVSYANSISKHTVHVTDLVKMAIDVNKE